MIEWIVWLCAFGAYTLIVRSLVADWTSIAELKFHNALERLAPRGARGVSPKAVHVVTVGLDWDGHTWRGIIPAEDMDYWSVLAVPWCNEKESGAGRERGDEA